jgi:hypothetical protein
MYMIFYSRPPPWQLEAGTHTVYELSWTANCFRVSMQATPEAHCNARSWEDDVMHSERVANGSGYPRYKRSRSPDQEEDDRHHRRPRTDYCGITDRGARRGRGSLDRDCRRRSADRHNYPRSTDREHRDQGNLYMDERAGILANQAKMVTI